MLLETYGPFALFFFFFGFFFFLIYLLMLVVDGWETTGGTSSFFTRVVGFLEHRNSSNRNILERIQNH